MTLTGRNFEATSLITRGDSSRICERIFRLHFNNSTDPTEAILIPKILDLTFGQGVFWKWLFKRNIGTVNLITNDLSFDSASGWTADFRHMPFETNSFDVVVFDPPFMSSGSTQYNGYGNDRKQAGAPQNRGDTRWLLIGGMKEAMRLATVGIIVKTQVVVESRQTWNNPLLVELMLEADPHWYLDDVVYQHTSKRRQPPDRKVEHFQGKPSVWLIAKRRKKAQANPEFGALLRDLADKML